LKYAEEALRLEPDRPACMSFLIGVLGLLREFERAAELSRRLLFNYPNNPKRWFGLAEELLHDMKRPSEALDAYRKAVDLEPSNIAFQPGLIKGLSAAGQHDDAIEYAEHLLEDPSRDLGTTRRAHIYEDLGHAFVRAKRWTEAEQAYEHALSLEPTNDPNHRGRVESQLRKLDEFLSHKK